MSAKALAQLGRMLKEMPKNKGASGSIVTGNKRVPVMDGTPTLEEMGLDKKTSKLIAIGTELEPREKEEANERLAVRSEKFSRVKNTNKGRALDKVASAIAIGTELEPREKEEAKKRKATNNDERVKFTPSEKGKPLDKVASAVGMSRPTYQRASDTFAVEASGYILNALARMNTCLP